MGFSLLTEVLADFVLIGSLLIPFTESSCKGFPSTMMSSKSISEAAELARTVDLALVGSPNRARE